MPSSFSSMVGPGLIVAALAFGSVSVSTPVWALTAYTADQQMSADAIAGFNSNPSQVLSQNPAGGQQMISYLRDLVASDSNTLAAVLGLAANANSSQKSAIASALVQAARLYAKTDPAFANQIQEAVANTRDQELILAFTAAAGDQPIAATGDGGGGGVGGPTGSPGQSGGTNAGGVQVIGGNGGNGAGTESFAGLSGGFATGSGGSNNNSSTAVSPF